MQKPKKMTPMPTLRVRRGLYAACHVAMAGYEAAEGRGDVSNADAERIEEAMAWIESLSASRPA